VSDPGGDTVSVHLADGHTAQFDFVVCADGPQSVGRRLLFPAQPLQYVGYILWRGLAEEQAVANSPLLEDRVTWAVSATGYCLLYLVPSRTGLLKMGLPGAKEGLQPEDPTLADLLKAQGYVTGQFGKNHLGDRDEHLPTAHGFDEFFGSLYHLNAEDEPEHPDYPQDREFRQKFGPRGVLQTYADGRVTNTGPLTKKRMETVDEEFAKSAIDFMQRAKKVDKPFFVWLNATRMHIWTRLKKESEGKTGLGIYPDGMVEHDALVGEVLKALDDLGLADNTIVMYSTDNGAEKFTWPDGGQSPFRGEKNTNWEGGYRVPAMVRWPGTIKPGSVFNDIVAHEDWMPTLLAAAGDAQVKDKLRTGYKAGTKSFKVHLDGYNLTDYLAGKAPDPRKEFFYFNDDGSLVALRYNQ
jgi:arylsulfatase